ncbi:MAG: PilZ domain-containing protein [Candidatus Zixiibacteriota bacterium]
MEELRKLERCQANRYLGVYDQKTGKLLGCIVDLSLDGIQLFGKETFRDGSIYKLKLILHKEIDGACDLFFEAKNAWCIEHAELGMYAAGFELVNLGEKTKERIEKLIQSSAFKKIPVEFLD